MQNSPVPAFVPEEWAPRKMTRKAYNAERAHLLAQQEAAQQVVAAFETAFAGPAAHASLSIDDSVNAAWNKAHDMVTALEFEVQHLDRAWSSRNVDPYQRFLVANNCD